MSRRALVTAASIAVVGPVATVATDVVLSRGDGYGTGSASLDVVLAAPFYLAAVLVGLGALTTTAGVLTPLVGVALLVDRAVAGVRAARALRRST